jgi:hypothetical protein
MSFDKGYFTTMTLKRFKKGKNPQSAKSELVNSIFGSLERRRTSDVLQLKLSIIG